MIAVIDQVAAGGALQVILQARECATRIRVCQAATADVLVDANAGTIVYEGTELAFLDGPGLPNGVARAYRAFYLIGGAWVASDPVTQTPYATFADYSVDPLGLLRDRLAAGFVELVRRYTVGDTTPGPQLNPQSGAIPVLFGTPSFDSANFPLVTLHLDSDADTMRGIGEVVTPPIPGTEYAGWIDADTVSVTAFSLNYDERKAMRQALKAILIANFTIFDAAGLETLGLTLSDHDDLTSFPAPVYTVMARLTCKAPTVIGMTRPVVTGVDVSLNEGGCNA